MFISIRSRASFSSLKYQAGMASSILAQQRGQVVGKTPKLYFLDTGLVCYLTGWTSPETAEAGAMSGALFETWVMGQILKSWWCAGQEAPLFFYRDKDGKELDGLLVRDGTLYPLEIKKTASPKRDDIRHFATLNRMGMTVGQGSVSCLCRETLPISETVWSLPASQI